MSNNGFILVQHLVIDGSLDARMVKRLVEKQAVIDAAMDNITPIEAAAPVFASPEAASTETVSRKQVEKEAVSITPEQITAVHRGLQILAGMCDGAAARDNHGFSKIDAHIGHSLANSLILSPKQGVLGKRLCIKYQRQLAGTGILEVIRG